MSSSDRIPLEGVLNCWNDDHDLPDLLLFVCRTKKTGRLAFSNPEGDKTLHIRSGKIVFAESSSGDDGLGHYLLRTGKVSLMDYLRVSKLVEPGKRLGALLVAEGVMEPKDLAPAVLGQVRAIILGLFRRTETWYRFKEETLSSETITLDLPVESLVLDGVRQVESWRRISKGVGQLESQYRCVEDKQTEWEGANFPPVVEEIFEMLRKPVSVAEICTQATLPDFEACRYLWAFRCLGWIQPLNEKPKMVEAKPTAPPAARDIATQPNAGQVAPLGPPPAATRAPRPKIDSKFRRPTIIPQQLIETKVAFDPPKLKPEKTSTGTTQRVTPAPVIPDLGQSDVGAASLEAPPPSEKPEGVATTPPPIPAALAQTNLAIEPPSAKAPIAKSEPPEAKDTPPSVPEVPPPPKPKPIPEGLAHTNLAIEPPKAPGQSSAPAENSAATPAPLGPPPRPRPIPEDLAHTNLAIEAPSLETTSTSTSTESEAPSPPRPIPEELAHTNLAIEPPSPKDRATPATPREGAEGESESEPEAKAGSDVEARAPSMADVATGGLAHTQFFVGPPEAPAPPSTGEMMESILSGQSSPDVHARSQSPELSDPDLDASSSSRRSPSESTSESESESQSTATGSDAPARDERDDPESPETPAGFEALAFEDSDPSISSIEDLSMPRLSAPDLESPAPFAIAPEPAPVADSPRFEEEDAMASFQDLAYSPEPAPLPPPAPQPEPQSESEPDPEPEVVPSVEPVVEASVESEPIPVFEAEPEGPAAEPPVLAPPPPPPRKRGPDEGFDLDSDGLAHLLTRNND